MQTGGISEIAPERVTPTAEVEHDVGSPAHRSPERGNSLIGRHLARLEHAKIRRRRRREQAYWHHLLHHLARGGRVLVAADHEGYGASQQSDSDDRPGSQCRAHRTVAGYLPVLTGH